MKYLKYFEAWTPLLDLEGNVDTTMINNITNLIKSGKILEISCGNGADTKKLLDLGYDVTCTENNEGYCDYVNKFANCVLHDTSKPFPFNDNQFDLVYSRLGLHYFDKYTLSDIFSEINRISNGYLVYSVKILDDPLTEKVILSKKDWESITKESGFDIISSEAKSGELYGKYSEWLEIIASKINI